MNHTRCGAKGENCPIYGDPCGSDIERCPVYRAFRIIGKKWILQLLQEFSVNAGKRRFSELQRSLYWITPRVISQRLKELVEEGLIRREVFPDNIPVKVQYSLTVKGKDLDKVIIAARKWGRHWEVEEK